MLVLSRTLATTPVPEALRGKVAFADLTPQAAMAHLQRQGAGRVYVDGGQIVQAFLREGLVADMIVSRIPVLIGEGRRLFGATGKDIVLKHRRTMAFPSGLVQSSYAVA